MLQPMMISQIKSNHNIKYEINARLKVINYEKSNASINNKIIGNKR